jgi:hypothetical protein
MKIIFLLYENLFSPKRKFSSVPDRNLFAAGQKNKFRISRYEMHLKKHD